MTTPQPALQHARTKIVATVGPACEKHEQLAALVASGVDVFRLNMAHGTRDEHDRIVASIAQISGEINQPIGVLVDLAGPKIRLGELAGGAVDCRSGELIRIRRGETAAAADELVSSYQPLIDDLAVGDRIMLADGIVSLLVADKTAGDDFVMARVVQPGIVRSRQGLNLPGVKISSPALTADDRESVEWAAKAGVDFVGLSFLVRAAADVVQLKQLLQKHGSTARVVAKIEKQEALDVLEDVVAAADCVMVARGDLGVEIDIARVAVAQKRIVAVCNRLQRPVIVATQMLDSMQHSRQPTRAEVSDVSNAILDGADACMLSGETAAGEFPQLAVETMNRIALATEPLVKSRPPLGASDQEVAGLRPITRAVVDGASRIAAQLDARLIAVVSRSGASALALSKLRCSAPIIGFSPSPVVLRQMSLYWGVLPMSNAPTADPAALLKFVLDWGRQNNLLARGHRIVMIAGVGAASTAGHNVLVVHEVG